MTQVKDLGSDYEMCKMNDGSGHVVAAVGVLAAGTCRRGIYIYMHLL